MQTLRRKRCQTRTRPRKNACVYGVRVSGATIYSYVGGDPLSFSDPMGLLRGLRNTSRTCVLCGRNIYQQQAAAIWRQYEAKMQLEAQQNAFLRNYREALGRHEHYGDGLGALSGAGAEIRHPSVPNSLEDLINPRRKLPWVPQIPPTGAPNCSRYPSASASPSP